MNRKPYPEYKESGVEWLGQVPQAWAVTKGRYIGSLLGSVTVSENDFEDDGTETESGILYAKVDDLNRIDGSLILKNTNTQVAGYRAFSAPFLLFPKRGAAIFTNKVAIALHPMLFDPNLMGWRVNSTFNVKFVAYCLIARRLDDLADVSTVPQINNKHINPSGFPYPSLPEQIAIADFLDRETGRIDTLVAKKRRLIALLVEKRTALISRTVTRGLPADAAREFGIKPHTRFKDSGIEWLGKVPEGWDLKKVRHVARVIIGITYSPDDVVDESEGVLVLRASNVQNGKLSFNDNVYVEKEIKDSDHVKEGDILICSRNGSAHLVGKCAYITAEHAGYTFGAFMSVVRSDFGLYLYQFFNSDIFKAQSGLFSTSTINQLTSSTLENMVVAFPPKEEQTAIATHLDRETTKINQLVTKVEAAIARLQEYRTALITAAVTGKIDVREEVA